MSADGKRIQAALNKWTGHWVLGVTPLRVDGDIGPATKTRIRQVRYWLGYAGRSSAWSTHVHWRTEHPRRTRKGYATRKDVARGITRRVAQRTRYRRERFHATVAPNVTRFDGVPCAIWIAKELQKVRNAGRWKGRLNSGWRSPSYSRSLCIAMCGAPTCPGRCAGVTSNHSGSVKPAGAADVSDYVTFGAECRRLGIPLHNALGAADPVHFSNSGH